LVAGQAASGRALNGYGAMYSFQLPPNGNAKQVTVAVTPERGDPDLYVKLGGAALPDPASQVLA